MEYQRLRNLTTGRLHTRIDYVYQDLGMIVGDANLMTHMLPRVMDAVRPWLRAQATDHRFWDGEYDTSHVGDWPLPAMTKEERDAALALYAAMPNPLAEKEVVVITVDKPPGG